jgi:hypothetical protein
MAPKLLHFVFFEDFRSKNGLPASNNNKVVEHLRVLINSIAVYKKARTYWEQ